jgi:DNA-binding transcriptional ArsR family regulator
MSFRAAVVRLGVHTSLEWTKRLLTPLQELRILYYMVNNSSEQLTTVFLALADPTRRAILERLAHGEASGTELARPFSISVPAISKHLRVLKNADLILHRKDGRTHMFRLAASPMREAANWLEHYRQFWEAQLDSLDTYLQVTSEEEHDPDDPFSIS